VLIGATGRHEGAPIAQSFAGEEKADLDADDADTSRTVDFVFFGAPQPHGSKFWRLAKFGKSK
jgi:hypothetical protein